MRRSDPRWSWRRNRYRREDHARRDLNGRRIEWLRRGNLVGRPGDDREDPRIVTEGHACSKNAKRRAERDIRAIECARVAWCKAQAKDACASLDDQHVALKPQAIGNAREVRGNRAEDPTVARRIGRDMCRDLMPVEHDRHRGRWENNHVVAIYRIECSESSPPFGKRACVSPATGARSWHRPSLSMPSSRYFPWSSSS